MAVLLENEQPKEARTYLDIALTYWADADKDYIPFERATALSERSKSVEGKFTSELFYLSRLPQHL